ncbi:WD40 repeat domain-containing protein [Candidatus Dependentiae bacterium]|nr:WD40 repeat domain-containing protein [Candidatus Dependentiae bacterium]
MAKTVLTASHDGTARLWAAKTGDQLLLLETSNDPITNIGRINGIQISKDGNTIMVGPWENEGKVHVWNRASESSEWEKTRKSSAEDQYAELYPALRASSR